MPVNDYADAVADLAEAVRENGRLVVILNPAEVAEPAPDSSFDPPGDSGPAEPDRADAYALQTMATTEEANGSRILSGDRRYLFDASVPITEESIIYDQGRGWPVAALDPIQPGEVLIGWKAWSRLS